MKNFFISYSHKDSAWADWVAWALSRIGYDVIMQRWDFSPGSNIPASMHAAIQDCERLILILSANALSSEFVTSEWTAYFAKDPLGKRKLLIPLRVEPCEPVGLLKQIVYMDLFGIGKFEAEQRLEKAIGHVALKPYSPPIFPGVQASRTVIGPEYPEEEPPSRNRPAVNALNAYLETVKSHKLPSLRTRFVGRAFVTSHIDALIRNLLSAGRQPAVLTLDVDGMGNINTKFGVDAGDLVIDRLFHFCESLRGSYLVARIGDDTILTVVTFTDLNKIHEVARRLIRKIADADWSDIGENLFVHCSSGVAAFHVGEDGFDAVLRASEGQRSARMLGGNRAEAGPHYVPVSVRKKPSRVKGPRSRRILPDS